MRPLDSREITANLYCHDLTANLSARSNMADNGSSKILTTGAASKAQELPVADEMERLENMVQARTRELSSLASHLQNVIEDERRILARALHDELGSVLTAAKLDAAFLKANCVKNNPAMLPKFERLTSMLEQGMSLQRRIIDELRPSTLDLLGLVPAVRELGDLFSAKYSISIQMDIDNEIAPVNGDALALYRIVGETLANVRKHAQAMQVTIAIARAGQLLHLRVADNGRGFDPSLDTAAGGHGLSGVRQRVRTLGGRFSLDSNPGNGTVIEVWIPYRPEVP